MNTIEFAPANETNTNSTTSPWMLPQREKKPYEDMILNPEYSKRVLQFPVGTTWLRIVPALATSARSWMLPLHVLGFEGGRFAHPRSLKPKAKSIFDHAYAWAKTNAPESLFSKTNKSGVRLLSDPMCLFWVITEIDEKQVARLLLASGYDGTRGGVPGLGWKIWQLCHDRDENGQQIADAVSADGGVLVSIEKSQPKGAKYPTYQLRLGRQPRPMSELLELMEPEERKVLCPLEDVVRELSDEEQWACLEKVISPENVALIRASLGQ